MSNNLVIRKGYIKIVVNHEFFDIYVEDFDTVLRVQKTGLDKFLIYLNYMRRKFLTDRMSCEESSIGTYHDDEVYFGSDGCVKYEKYGNFLRFSDMPTIINLLKKFDSEHENNSIMSIIKNIKNIKRM